jgi:hypothetical protein
VTGLARRRSGGWWRPGARRAVSGGLTGLLAIPVVLALTGAGGLPRSRVELSGGGAWLASPTQGLVTLIDGASEQVVGSVRAPGARAGDDLSVAQQGSSAYVVNSARGTVSRVDGGTYEASAPVRFGGGGAGGLLQVYPGTTSGYVVDGQRRVASVIDPKTLRVRDRLALTAQPGPGQSVVDSAGRLWVVGAGGLTWFDQSGQHVQPELGGTAARLVLIGGHPVLVDLSRSRVGWLTDDGTISSWSCLQLPAGEQTSLLGSTSLGRVLAAVPATGTLVLSGSGNDGCGVTVDIGRPGDAFGPLVETGGFLFVPNRSLGRTTIVDLSSRQVVADLAIVKPGAHLELLAKDGVVFYNDLDSDRAGVIRLDGGKWRPGKALRKFNPAKAGDGLLLPGGNQANGGKPANQPGTKKPQPKPDDPQQADPKNPDPGSTDPNQPPPDQSGPNPPGGGNPDPSNPDPNNPDPTPSPTPTDPGTGPPPPPPPTPPVINSLTWTPDPVGRGQDVTFSADVTNTTGATWSWVIVDPANGSSLQQQATPDQATFNLPPGSPANLEIRLDVSNQAGAAPTMTKPFTTTSSTVPQITSLTANPDPAGIGQQVTFHAVESKVGANADRWVWVINGPGGASVSPQVAPGVDLVETFDRAGQYTVTLTVEFDGATDRRSVPVTVADDATLTAVSGSPVDLRGGPQTVQVRLANSFVAQTVQVTKAAWLSVSDTSIPVQPNGTATVTVSVTGTPPADGVNGNALTFQLTNGQSVAYAVQVNIAPVITSMSCLATQLGQIPVTHFSVSATDADPGTLTAVIHVASATFTMQRLSAGNGEALFGFDRQINLVPKADTWTVVVTDSSGLQKTQTAPRNDCWPP